MNIVRNKSVIKIKMERMNTRDQVIAPNWMDIYVWAIASLGLLLFITAIGSLRSDWRVIGLFIILAGISELFSVELFKSSRNSRVSVSSIVALAGIMISGPTAGILVHGFSGLITMVPNTFLTKLPKQGRGSMIKRGLFNLGMFVLSAYLAGLTYRYLGANFKTVISVSNILPLVGAALVDAIANIGILLGVLNLQTRKPVAEIWRQNFEWSVPITILGGILGGGALAIAFELAGFWGIFIFFLPVLSIGYSFRIYADNSREFINQLERVNAELKDSNQQLETNNQELMEALAAVVDAYDIYTYGHSTHVSDFAVAIARELDLDQEKIKLLEQAGLLHDIGKVGITDTIINKPGPLTPHEYEQVKAHPTIGAEIVSRMSGLQPLVPIILHHHERWDGGGYPDGLAGEDIPYEARILALADAVDTMRSDRPYRPPRSPELVLREIRQCSGSQFDPQIVSVFEKIIARQGYAFLEKPGNANHLLHQGERYGQFGNNNRPRSKFSPAIKPPPGEGK